MSTIAIPFKKSEDAGLASSKPFSAYAVLSLLCVVMFVGYIASYRVSHLYDLTAWTAFASMLFLLVAPALAFILSVVSLRNGIRQKLEVRGMLLAYVSFFVSALYFTTALAMPIVLLGFYFVYVYIW